MRHAGRAPSTPIGKRLESGYFSHNVQNINRLVNRFYPCHISRVAQFDLHKLREIADEGIARHGLRGYARKLGLDVSTMRSLRDGRDMQISKVLEIVAALDMSLELRPAGVDTGAAATGAQSRRL